MADVKAELTDHLVKSIAALAIGTVDETRITSKDGRVFTDKALHEVVLDAVEQAPILALTSLDSLVSFMEQEKGFAEQDGVGRLVVIDNVQRVELVGPLSGWPRPKRQKYAIAGAPDCVDVDKVGYQPIEAFLIFLRTKFALTEPLAKLLEVLGNASWEQGITQADDGVSQTLTTRAGTVLPTAVTIPKLIPLRPYRTFRDIDQPESDFILRTQGDARTGVSAKLFEADGGAWRLEAMKNIKAWFTEKKIPAIG
jgi:hypothetical protein